MMTSRLRTTVRRVMMESTVYVMAALVFEGFVFLQELLDMGKQSSSSGVSMVGEMSRRGRAPTPGNSLVKAQCHTSDFIYSPPRNR